jgi:anti-anti-sigma factor
MSRSDTRDHTTDHVVVVAIPEVDRATLAAFARAIHPPDGARRLVVDLGQVTFIDASGAAVLLALHDRLRSEGGALVIRRPRANVRRVFDLVAPERLVVE